jgi:hypothetical protein
MNLKMGVRPVRVRRKSDMEIYVIFRDVIWGRKILFTKSYLGERNLIHLCLFPYFVSNF